MEDIALHFDDMDTKGEREGTTATEQDQSTEGEEPKPQLVREWAGKGLTPSASMINVGQFATNTDLAHRLRNCAQKDPLGDVVRRSEQPFRWKGSL